MTLKVGDRVSVYQEPDHWRSIGELVAIGKKIMVDSNGPVDVPVLIVRLDGDRNLSRFHPKQCRKLVRKPRQTLWVNHYPGESGFLFAWEDKNKALERVEGTRKEPGREILECVVVRRHKV